MKVCFLGVLSFLPLFNRVRAQTPSNYSAAIFANTGATGVAVGESGIVYATVANSIVQINAGGSIILLAGNAAVAGSSDGAGSSARFNSPRGIALDTAGNLYVADSGNNAIRKVTASGIVTTVAGLVQGNVDGVGTNARFNAPSSIAVDSTGNLYVADTGNNELRKIAPSGLTTTLISGTSLNLASGPYGVAYSVYGVTLDGSGNPEIGVVVNIPQSGAGNFPIVYVDVLRISGVGSYAQVLQLQDTSSRGEYGMGDGALATDGFGNLYVLCGNGLYIGSMLIPADLAAGVIGVTYNAVHMPTAIATDPLGRVFVANAPIGIVVIAPSGTAPSIQTQPSSSTIAYGASTTLSVSAAGSPTVTFQWQVNGVNIAGATAANYTTSTPGTYTVVVTNAAGSVTSNPAVVSAAARLIDISSRAQVGAGGNVMIAGFVVSGPPGTTEQVLARGVGPALSQFGISGLLAQPVLTLYGASGNVLATNTGWNTNPNAAQIAAAFGSTGAFALPADSADSALVISLPPGAYTAEVSGLNGTTGIALAEVYEVTAGSPELINISTRALVASGSSVEIAGIVISGTQSAKLLIRAVGPALTQFGVTGVLAQPVLNVVNSSGVTMASNTGWSTNSNAATIASETAAVGAFALPTGSADCAVLVTLPPGAYTAVVSGVGGSAGVALVEAYQAP